MTQLFIVPKSGVTTATPKVTAGSQGLGVGIPDRGAQGTGNFKTPKTRPTGLAQIVVATKKSSR